MIKHKINPQYIQAAMNKAAYKQLEDASYFGEIPGFQGVWANALTAEACRSELEKTLEDWLNLSLIHHHFHAPHIQVEPRTHDL